HLAGQGHFAGCRHHRAGDVPRRPAHRRDHLRATDHLCAGGADLSRRQLGTLDPAGAARKAPVALWRVHRGSVMIALEAIHKRFVELEVLRGVSVTVPERGVTALIGPSGSGKSTLLRCVNLLEIPQSGRLSIGGTTLDFSRGGHPAKADIL